MAYALAVWAVWIAWDDWRRRRIANASIILVLAPALLSLILEQRGLLGAQAWPAALGLGLAVAITLPGYALNMLGAGDVKYAATLGLLLGGWSAVRMMLVFALLLGSFAALVLWRSTEGEGFLKRRIAAAPALTLGFFSQLFVPLGANWW